VSDERDDRYRSLLDRYVALLQEWRELSDWPQRFPIPPVPAIQVIRGECPLRADPGLAELLVGPQARATGLRELRDFTVDVVRLTILDPYFFAGPADTARDVADEFARVARFQGKRLKAVHIIRDDRLDTKAVVSAIGHSARMSGVRLTHASSQELHDRVWIADSTRAVVVGTSFNGIGKRAAFILPLPEADLAAILEFLAARGLVRRPARRAAS
jgi:hypothetical protein